MTVTLEKKSAPLNQPPPPMPPSNNDLFGMEPNTYCMLLHLSQLLVFAVPVFGLVVPIVLWALNKDKNPMVDAHGKMVLNWLLSELVYTVASIVLAFVFIGVLTLLAVVALAMIFPIIGGIKAKDGILWQYPLTIPFFK